MAVTTAQALVPGLVIADSDPAAAIEGLNKLALWALQRISTVVMTDPPDGIESPGVQGFVCTILTPN